MSGSVAPETLARLQAAKGFVFDMDGTLVLADLRHKGANALPGAVDMVKAVAARGLPFVVFTNGTIKPPAALAHMLSEAGLPVATAQVVDSLHRRRRPVGPARRAQSDDDQPRGGAPTTHR